MKYLSTFTLLVLALLQFACNSVTDKLLREGTWRAVLTTKSGEEIPFTFDVEKTGEGTTHLIIRNGEERITVDEVRIHNDSVNFRMPIFDSEFKAVFQGQSLQGVWIKHLADSSVSMPFRAVPDQNYRFFKNPGKAAINLSGRWETLFIGKEGDSTLAIAEFKQEGNVLNGTFLTSTGDYRFLEGNVVDSMLYLSCFDGAHAYVFKAKAGKDSSLQNGSFHSGLSGFENWTAKKNAQAKLPDAYSLTYLKPGYDKISFSFPDMNGKKVSLSDPQFKGKVIILQLLGSWCPNCADESAYLMDLYNRYQGKDLEIIGLAYERNADFKKACSTLDRLKQRFYITYPLLIAGTNAKGKAQESLPMLNAVLGFPTTIIINKAGQVDRIHTGFTGPGTGEHYTEFVTEFEAHLQQLLSEK